jgi:Icc-related predicted phosphoesterase
VKIFATSDLHGNRAIIDKLRYMEDDCDLILICGDIGGKNYRTNSFREFSLRQREDVDYLAGILSGISTPARFILGNDDWLEYESEYYFDRTFELPPYRFIPFEHVLITPFNTNREANENKIRYELEKLTVGADTIIVAHTPPAFCGDECYDGRRVGSDSVHSWVEENQPRVWLCGHIHEDNSAHKIGETRVFNCACDYFKNILKGWMIDLETRDYESVSI